MKKLSLIISITIIAINALAQQKEFEGTIIYKVTTKSKTKDLDENYWRLLLAMNGDKLTIDIKDGNYKQSLGFTEQYYIPKDKRTYVKFKKIDTLYYLDYASDTNKVIDIIKSDSLTQINNIKCKSIILKRNSSFTLYRYTNSLYLDPVHDKENTIGNINAFVNESGGGVWLYGRTEYEKAVLTDSCIHIEQKMIDSHVFDLPKLPQKNLKSAMLYGPARFPGKENSWSDYLNKNLNADLALKYVKVPKGHDSASQTVFVSFVVAEDGTISNIEVENKKQVNSRLAEEAIRVIRDSPRWIPATLYGEKLKTYNRQPIVFAVK